MRRQPPAADSSCCLFNTPTDILAACINSNGVYLSGSSFTTLTACGNVDLHTGIPAVVSSTVDTVTSMLRMVRYPSSNVQILFRIVNFGNHTLPKVPGITTGRTTQVF